MEEICTREAKNAFVDNVNFQQKKWLAKEVNAFSKKHLALKIYLKNPELGQFDPFTMIKTI